jgi:hypothetical protein
MAKKNVLGESKTVRIVLPIALYRLAENAAQKENRKLSPFLRILIQENLTK